MNRDRCPWCGASVMLRAVGPQDLTLYRCGSMIDAFGAVQTRDCQQEKRSNLLAEKENLEAWVSAFMEEAAAR